MEGGILRLLDLEIDSHSCRNITRSLDRVGPIEGCPTAPPSSGLSMTDEHRGQEARLIGQQRLKSSQLRGCRPSVDPGSGGIADAIGGVTFT